ncbi:MAG: flagellar hook-length control protein FliK [Planctomycetes bacterium]|nr:flagellar hook-length control protein FliK [Planctomycetota bacterium]
MAVAPPLFHDTSARQVRSSPATPAELPSGSVRFADELGRETALLALRVDAPAIEGAPSESVERREAPQEESREELRDESPVREAEGPPRRERETAERDARRRTDGSVEGDTTPAPAEVDGTDPTEPRREDDETVTADEWAALEALLALGAPTAPPLPTAPTAPHALALNVEVATAALEAVTPAVDAAAALAQGPIDAKATTAVGQRGALAAAAPSDSIDGTFDATLADAPPSEGALGESLLGEGGGAASSGFAGDGAALLAEGDAPAATKESGGSIDGALAAALARDLAAAPRMPAALAPANGAAAASLAGPALPNRPLALHEVGPLLDAALDGVVRLRREGGRWEAEIRLDPAELGSLHVRLEMQGNHLHVVARAEDPQLQQQLGELFRDWQETLQKQGGDASFDLSGRAKEEEKRPAAAPGSERSHPASPLARRAAAIAAGAGERLDLLA